jgi:uracil-DNA glycosylase family 4
MSSRREEMLKEMGLAPLWTLRERARVGVAPPPALYEAGEAALEASAIVAASDSPLTAEEGAARRASIMQMDWLALKASVAECVVCPLHARRNKTVFGVGDENAAWMFIGEGPGADEDALGDPFVGQAGRLLDNMLAAIGLSRGENVYIANVVKCRPPGNRNPEPAEAEQCEPFLQRQIALVQPKLIVALGRIAAQNLLAREATIASLRGRLLDYKGIPLLVTYHPAYLLRNLTDKAKAWQDLCLAVSTMRGLTAKQVLNAQ